MAEETITIFRVDTGDAVQSVNDLKANVKLLKEQLGEMTIGTEEYQNTLNELKVNQNALKDAMYATTSSMEDLASSATGTSESYNSLVHRMASLKEELRATDVSTEAGKQRFRELAASVNEVNDRLKEMDAMQGNYQRNVGNYEGALKNFHNIVKDLPKPLHAVKGELDNVDKSLSLMSTNPIIGTVALISPLVKTLVEEIKDSDDAMASVKKMMDALKPVMDFFKNVLGQIVSFVGSLIGQLGEFLSSNGFFSQLIDGVVGVGNAILQYMIAPIKGVIAAIKVFQEEGIKGFRKAGSAFLTEMKSGISFRSNFKAGQAIAESMVKGMDSKKAELQDAGTEAGKEIAKGVQKGLQDLDKALAEGNRKIAEARKFQQDQQKLMDADTESEYESTLAELDSILERFDESEKERFKEDQQRKKDRISMMSELADATGSILGSIADMYESDEKAGRKNAEKVKALRIASAIIDTISGAIGAYMNAAKTYTPPVSQIVGAASAATITAAGMANIAKIRSTSVTSPSSAPAIVAAPATTVQMPSVRSITTASEEDRLNQLTSDQRVVLVMSDLEVKQNQVKVQVAEASF